MTLIWRGKNGDYLAFRVEPRLITVLTFAVRLQDDFSGQRPLGRVEVSLAGLSRKPWQNLSGYYLWTDLDRTETYTVTIEAEWYLPSKETVRPTDLEKKLPVRKIILKPNPLYPFPAAATLLRGVVKQNDQPVGQATVEVTASTASTITDAQGEFVLYFKEDHSNKVEIVIKKGATVKKIEKEIMEGKTTSAGVINLT